MPEWKTGNIRLLTALTNRIINTIKKFQNVRNFDGNTYWTSLSQNTCICLNDVIWLLPSSGVDRFSWLFWHSPIVFSEPNFRRNNRPEIKYWTSYWLHLIIMRSRRSRRKIYFLIFFKYLLKMGRMCTTCDSSKRLKLDHCRQRGMATSVEIPRDEDKIRYMCVQNSTVTNIRALW